MGKVSRFVCRQSQRTESLCPLLHTTVICVGSRLYVHLQSSWPAWLAPSAAVRALIRTDSPAVCSAGVDAQILPCANAHTAHRRMPGENLWIKANGGMLSWADKPGQVATFYANCSSFSIDRSNLSSILKLRVILVSYTREPREKEFHYCSW